MGKTGVGDRDAGFMVTVVGVVEVEVKFAGGGVVAEEAKFAGVGAVEAEVKFAAAGDASAAVIGVVWGVCFQTME